jgi:hypothetical protein
VKIDTGVGKLGRERQRGANLRVIRVCVSGSWTAYLGLKVGSRRRIRGGRYFDDILEAAQ